VDLLERPIVAASIMVSRPARWRELLFDLFKKGAIDFHFESSFDRALDLATRCGGKRLLWFIAFLKSRCRRLSAATSSAGRY